jgi:hypothetical protein
MGASGRLRIALRGEAGATVDHGGPLRAGVNGHPWIVGFRRNSASLRRFTPCDVC